ncbi:hypothetical protein [Streptomonospora litoralis]|uniref:Uncharacterized protein n=1 Tax=Streptomonospora litoralis TaxID=2498135 RepID=A0A4P6Q7K0_9ACTN|nr:hypothetical protein [Streptomonospora litoralis]QBI56776.1 hypothetical protein EKD16_25175 [Streptomonospora litoralis]
MDNRMAERDALHGPWPTEAEILQTEFPDWEIWRDVREDGTHGDWCASSGETLLRTTTCDELRGMLREQP